MKKGIISLLSAVTGGMAGAGLACKALGKSLTNTSNMSNKNLAMFLMMNQWVKVKQEGKNLAGYFEGNGYKKIAIYGMSFAGETLLDELNGTGIEVAYGIDRNADSIFLDVDVVKMDGELKEVDAIVVTTITIFDEIEKELHKRISCPVTSLEDVLYEV